MSRDCIMDIDTRRLQQLLAQAQYVPEAVVFKAETTSTNDDIREIAQKGITTALVCSARQTQGRGQHQRPWISPEGNIYLSTLLQTETTIDGRLALEVALNILQTPSLQPLKLQVKWPNDLYSPQGKWGGILVEPLTPHQAIIGVGINIRQLSDATLDQPVTSLSELGLQQPDPTVLIAELYVAIQQAGQWFSHGSHQLANRFNHHAAFLNDMVYFEHHQGLAEGKFIGIQNDGAVILQSADETHTFYQGRLRRQS